MVMESFITQTIKYSLFPLFDSTLTLEGFTEIISQPKNNLKLIVPERYRYAYIFENVYEL